MTEPLILTIDTATRILTVAVCTPERVISSHTWQPTQPNHTTALAPSILSLDSISDIQRIAVASGPGSFTGLRSGLAFAAGFALARQIPVIGIPTLQIPIHTIHEAPDQVVSVLEVGRGRWAMQMFARAGKRGWEPSGQGGIHTWAAIQRQLPTEPCWLTGELPESAPNDVANTPIICLPQPRAPLSLAQLAWQQESQPLFTPQVTYWQTTG